MEIKIKKVIYPGKSLAHLDGKTIFADEGLPGELVEVKPLAEKKKFTEAQTIRVIEPSAHRVAPRCSHYRCCSSYQYIDYETQLEIKEAQIKEIFLHTLDQTPDEVVVTPSPVRWGYRNKIRLNIVRRDALTHFAYHLPETHDEFVLADNGCHLASDQVNALLRELLAIIRADDKLGALTEVEVRESSTNKSLLLVLFLNTVTALPAVTKAAGKLPAEFPISGVVCVTTDGGIPQEHLIRGKDSIEETVGGKRFMIGARSFFQVNVPLLETVIAKLKGTLKLTRADVIVDAYCGVGTFGISLADEVAQVIGLEAIPENIAFLRNNIEINGVADFRIFRGPCERHLSQVLRAEIAALILDPPRKGISPLVCNQLLTNPPKRIGYLSCNPATLARDLKLLSSAFNIKDISVYDFFPHTPHIETLVILGRK
ncbi:MAG: 23S rRNA (uracil(1939)-C(5))-methyltransferase RlmD [Candidatus Omnitrophota bacterium]